MMKAEALVKKKKKKSSGDSNQMSLLYDNLGDLPLSSIQDSVLLTKVKNSKEKLILMQSSGVLICLL
jgi:hypothetical protein